MVTTANEILIMDTDDVETATKVWRWNVNGLGYSSTGYNGTFGTAITMDGQIVGSYIVAYSIGTEQISSEYTTWIEGEVSAAETNANTYTDNTLAGNYYTISQVTTKISNSASTVTLSAQEYTQEYVSGQLSSYYTKSEIKLLVDSISISVSGGKLGSTASIILSVDDTEISADSIDLSGIRSAFASDSSSIVISAGTVAFASNTLIVDSDYFKVSETGAITSTSGTIGGWTINDTQIYNITPVTSGTASTQYRMLLNASTSTLAGATAISVQTRSYDGDSTYGSWADGFRVTYLGYVFISGGATIGGWYVSSGSSGAIYKGCSSKDSTTAGTYIGTDAIRQYASSSAYVHIADGVITAVGGNFSGKITAGSGSSFGGWTIADNAIYRTSSAWGASGGMYFGSSGLSVGSTFTVSSAGHLKCTSATIGGFTVDSSSFTSGGISLSPDGITATDDSTAAISGGTISTKLDDDDNTNVQIIGDSIYMFGQSGYTSGNIMGRLKPVAQSEIYKLKSSASSSYGMYFGLPSYSNFFCLGYTVSGSDYYYPVFSYSDYYMTIYSSYTYIMPDKLVGGAPMVCMVDDVGNTLQTLMANNGCLYFGTEDTTATYLYGDAIYVNVSIKVSSDEKLKTDISDISKYSGVFDKMQSLTYRYKGSPDKIHFGFTTQGTEEAFSTNGYDPEDYAILGTFEKDGETYGALAHEEIIALLVYEVQQLKTQVKTLQASA